MNCNDARFALAADPRSDDPTLLEHLERCASCAAYAGDMHEIDRRLRDALAIPAPEVDLPSGPYPAAAIPAPEVDLPSGPYPAAAIPTAPGGGLARRGTTRRFALAASIAGVAVLAGLLWAGFPRESLASAVVGHMAHEPDAWSVTTPLPAADLEKVMSRSNVRLEGGLPDVTYANSCWFRGRHVPHLVVQTPDGPVTVLVLPEEPVDKAISFDEGGYRGTLVPARRGSIAVLARGDADIARVAGRALAAIIHLD